MQPPCLAQSPGAALPPTGRRLGLVGVLGGERVEGVEEDPFGVGREDPRLVGVGAGGFRWGGAREAGGAGRPFPERVAGDADVPALLAPGAVKR